jgi:hypothetical protein
VEVAKFGHNLVEHQKRAYGVSQGSIMSNEVTREPSGSDWKTAQELFYTMSMLERRKPIVDELLWVLLDCPNLDQHIKLLPDYCYKIFEVQRKTTFKALPMISDIMFLKDQAALASAKTVDNAKKAVRIDWGNLGRVFGFGLRCMQVVELEASNEFGGDGVDELTGNEANEFLMMNLGKRWVTENQARIMTETPGEIMAETLHQEAASNVAEIRKWEPYFNSLGFQWGPEALIQFNEGVAEGLAGFLDANREFVGESGRAGIYGFLLLVWPEIKAMLECNPKKTVTDLHEWMKPFMRVGMVTYMEDATLRQVCAPPPRGIGLSLRPFKPDSAQAPATA